MSDITPPPTPPAAPPPPATPSAVPAASPKQGLSLTGFIVGIASLVFSWVPFFGLILAIAGIVISLIARTKEPAAPKWMWIVGLITAIVGGVTALFVTIFTIIGIVALASLPAYNYNY